METIHKRGLSLKTKHDNGSISVEDNGGDHIKVQSETSSGKTYTVNLVSLECSCPYYEKVKFAGMLCKHIFLANELLGDKYRTPQPVPSRPQTVSHTSPEKLDIGQLARISATAARNSASAPNAAILSYPLR
jgi:hypothetical protein